MRINKNDKSKKQKETCEQRTEGKHKEKAKKRGGENKIVR